jgi:hypothetical protein
MRFHTQQNQNEERDERTHGEVLRLCRVVCVVKICKVSRCLVVIPNRGCGLDSSQEKIFDAKGRAR